MKDIIWIKSKSRLACHKCDIKKLCNYAPTEKIEVLGPCNDKFGYYKFNNPEPEKIQSEYEWMNERYKLLENRDTSSEETAEYLKLQRWLEENKPEQWEICTKENTQVGDEVRHRDNKEIICIEHLFKYKPEGYHDTVFNCDKVTSHGLLSHYEINKYKE